MISFWLATKKDANLRNRFLMSVQNVGKTTQWAYMIFKRYIFWIIGWSIRLVFLVLIILWISYNALLCKKNPLLKQFEAHEITFDHIVWEFAYSFGRALSYNYCLHVTLDWSAQNGDEQILQWLETHNKVMLTEDLFHLSPAYNYNRCKFFNVS